MIIIVNINNRGGISVQITKGTIFSKKVYTVMTQVLVYLLVFFFLFWPTLLPITFPSVFLLLYCHDDKLWTVTGYIRWAGSRAEGTSGSKIWQWDVCTGGEDKQEWLVRGSSEISSCDSDCKGEWPTVNQSIGYMWRTCVLYPFNISK